MSPLVIGLTGGIAMGKSRVARLLQGFGVPVFDADAAVHALLRAGSPVVGAVEAAFPGVGDDAGGIDRKALGARVFGDLPALRRLEAILHPAVRAAERRFLGRLARQRFAMAALDIPLLLETGAERLCDCVVVVDAGPELQAARALARPWMSRARLAAIRAQQMPSAEKQKRADFVLRSGYDRGASAAAVAALLDRLETWPRRAWPARWKGAGRVEGH
ncbi:MAG: dephospho-CoA kinase [Geminicoccaceae bacterium]|nr:dephospho-CoA kinase [Geminicoccaceae bacterium]